MNSPRGFTLVELLVSSAVLLLVILLVAQITDGAARSVALGGRRIDADTQARLIFNRLSADFSGLLIRSDVDYSSFKQPAATLPPDYTAADGSALSFPANLQPGNDRFACYTETSGYSTELSGTQKAPVALVAWQVAPDPATGKPALLRKGQGLGWESGGSGAGVVRFLPSAIADQWPALFSDTQSYSAIGEQVFRLEYLYLLKSRGSRPARLSLTPWDADSTLVPAHTSVDGFRDVSAINISIAILDTSSRVIVSNFIPLTNALPDAAESGGSVIPVTRSWSQILKTPSFAAGVGIPAQAAAGIRIYERSFHLD